MQKKIINSQLGNFKTYYMYLRRCETLAENVFDIKNIPEYIDTAYINKVLVHKGSIAWFRDEIMGLLALPYVNLGVLDVYGRPTKIQVIGQNGYIKTLKKDEFVIMYDNEGRYPLYMDIVQYAERIALDMRTIDINITQQKTPRVWKTDTAHELSLRRILNDIDANANEILTYEDINLDGTECILEPAPYVADKITLEKKEIWNEFLAHIGIANLSVTKKERQITDEISAQQGGTIASRFSRFTPRVRAIDMINKLLIKDGEEKLEVAYYDGLPTSMEDSDNANSQNDNIETEEGDIND